jgi:hypothetical protein
VGSPSMVGIRIVLMQVMSIPFSPAGGGNGSNC